MSKKSNKRIAKNAIFLYFRLLLTMVVALYTSRVVLKSLGIEDYGIQNVVGGVVSMIGVIKGAMTGASTRFFNIALGKSDYELANKYFCVNLTIFFALSLLFLLLAETIGLWFVNTHLTIPDNRIVAANWIYQFSIFTLVNSLTAIPYNATIVAHEKMGIYAYLGILEAIFKLLIAFFLLYIPWDRLIVYGALLLLSQIIIRMISRVYCMVHYSECKYRFYSDKHIYKEILSYSGWNLFGVVSNMIKGQGLNILINMFFSPAVNAARAVSYQVNHSIVQLGTNFYTAVRPQVIKNYAANNFERMIELVFWSSKVTFFLMTMLALPIFIDAENMIHLWLGDSPEHTVGFVRFMMVISLLDAISHPISTSIQATGKVALFQITVSIMIFFNIPISYFLLSKSFSPITVYQVSLIIQSLVFIVRVFILNRYIKFPIGEYFHMLGFRCFCPTIIAFGICYYLCPFFGSGFLSVVAFACLSVIVYISFIAVIGLSDGERKHLFMLIKERVLSKFCE